MPDDQILIYQRRIADYWANPDYSSTTWLAGEYGAVWRADQWLRKKREEDPGFEVPSRGDNLIGAMIVRMYHREANLYLAQLELVRSEQDITRIPPPPLLHPY